MQNVRYTLYRLQSGYYPISEGYNGDDLIISPARMSIFRTDNSSSLEYHMTQALNIT